MLKIVELEGAYIEINQRFFKSKLPYLPVRYYKLPNQMAGRTQYVYNKGHKSEPSRIHINSKLKNFDMVAIEVLIHEMVHVSVGYKAGHGPKFKKEIKRLLRAGAYDPLV